MNNTRITHLLKIVDIGDPAYGGNKEEISKEENYLRFDFRNFTNEVKHVKIIKKLQKNFYFFLTRILIFFKSMEVLFNCLNDIKELMEKDNDVVFLVFCNSKEAKKNICMIFTILLFTLKYHWTIEKSKKIFFRKNYDFSFFAKTKIFKVIKKFESFIESKLSISLSNTYIRKDSFREEAIMNNTSINAKKYGYMKQWNDLLDQSEESLSKSSISNSSFRKNIKKTVKWDEKNLKKNNEKKKTEGLNDSGIKIYRRDMKNRKYSPKITRERSISRESLGVKEIRENLMRNSSLRNSSFKRINHMVECFKKKHGDVFENNNKSLFCSMTDLKELGSRNRDPDQIGFAKVRRKERKEVFRSMSSSSNFFDFLTKIVKFNKSYQHQKKLEEQHKKLKRMIKNRNSMSKVSKKSMDKIYSVTRKFPL